MQSLLSFSGSEQDHSLPFTISIDSSICFFAGLADGHLCGLQESGDLSASDSWSEFGSLWPSVASLSRVLMVRNRGRRFVVLVSALCLAPYTEQGMGLALKACRCSFDPSAPSSATIFASLFLLSLSRKWKGCGEAAAEGWFLLVSRLLLVLILLLDR